MGVLIWSTSVLAVLGIFAVWANRQVLNPNNWSSTPETIGRIASNYDFQAS